MAPKQSAKERAMAEQRKKEEAAEKKREAAAAKKVAAAEKKAAAAEKKAVAAKKKRESTAPEKSPIKKTIKTVTTLLAEKEASKEGESGKNTGT
jgi:hypothetical protein